MRLALFQADAEPGAPDRNLDRLERAAGDVAKRGAQLLVGPEMGLTGYNLGPEAVRALAEPPDGAMAQRVAGIARRLGLGILYGYPELGEGGAVYNAAQLIGPNGARLINHRKAHLYGDLDRGSFTPGTDSFAVAEVGGIRVGVMICYDVEFPELVRRHALAGVDALLVPTALMHPYTIVANGVVPTRAFENGIFVAYANRCGREGVLHYCGLSTVAGPDGSVLSRAGEGEEILVVDIDPALRAVATHLADRRPDLYGTPSPPLW
ncbi:carbon-nitrogen hydrolase family protein [Azospirillum canadense]|uniref:carbon-nitrogen hydrolase family protein n=1 Tax=Azospirillum canadense TaxID=403962 RepID=UPI00222644BD|nr:carbon-nitrogen hydrolase family protein [Azospirillum canadense]MCW2240181.1 putative amidohydrolase [Azospirillum canadense]